MATHTQADDIPMTIRGGKGKGMTLTLSELTRHVVRPFDCAARKWIGMRPSEIREFHFTLTEIEMESNVEHTLQYFSTLCEIVPLLNDAYDLTFVVLVKLRIKWHHMLPVTNAEKLSIVMSHLRQTNWHQFYESKPSTAQMQPTQQLRHTLQFFGQFMQYNSTVQ